MDFDAHHDLARELAVRGSVVLANDGLLPLDGSEQVAVVGPNADEAKVGGGGSSEVTPTRTVSPVEGIRERARAVAFRRGADSVADPSMFDPPWRGVSRRFRSGEDREPAVHAAAAADVAVVVVQDGATEGEDRESMGLPGTQDGLVRAVARANPRTVVVCRSSGPVAMPWVDDVAAVVETWYPGQADGAALADVLYGEDPGGRLPVTFGRRFADYPVAGDRRYPGVDGHVHYDEGLFVGYRHFDREDVQPLFPFGHGLSYAEFDYRDLTVGRADEDSDRDSDDNENENGGVDNDGNDGLSVAVMVENASERPGREVVQAYVAPPNGPVDRPDAVLGGFASLSLDGGEERRVSTTVPRRVLARYDERDGWTVDPGEYTVRVGRSATDLRLSTDVVE